MIESYVPKNHISLTSSAEILAISSSLFKVTGLNSFSYGRIFNKNLFFFLPTSIPLFLSWLRIKLIAREPLGFHYLKEGVYRWEDTQNNEFLKEAHHLNYCNGITIIKHHKTFSESFIFGAPVGQSNVISLYFNHMELLNKFNLYFKDQASKLIDQAIRQPLTFPNNMSQKKEQIDESQKLDEYKNSLFIKKYNINDKYHDIKLSKRELQCLTLYLKRKTTTQIAKALNLQKSAVDNFIFRVKKKFQCKTSSELFALFWELGILKSNGWFDI